MSTRFGSIQSLGHGICHKVLDSDSDSELMEWGRRLSIALIIRFDAVLIPDLGYPLTLHSIYLWN